MLHYKDSRYIPRLVILRLENVVKTQELKYISGYPLILEQLFRGLTLVHKIGHKCLLFDLVKLKSYFSRDMNEMSIFSGGRSVFFFVSTYFFI